MQQLDRRALLGVAIASVCLTTAAHSSPAWLACADSVSGERWALWSEDLDYLLEEIEKPSSLKQIFKTKGIDWKKVRKEVESRFSKLAKAAKKRRKDDELADRIAFYGLLHHLIGQLRDTHARLIVDKEVEEAWREAQPPRFDAGIEFLPGAHGMILVSNTFAARGANSPLYQKGVRHEQTVLVSVNGTDADEYFEDKAREIWEVDGWQSSEARAYIEGLNSLSMAEGESLKLVFKTLELPDNLRERYLEGSAKQRAKEAKRLKWKEKKVSLRANECTQASNARNFRFLALELPELTESSAPSLWYGTLPSGYGYIRYTGVSEKSLAGMQQACGALEACPGLVLDMRLNGGGGNSAVKAFNAQEEGWDKPLAVLMGPKTMSQGETEIWSLRDMREARQCNLRLFGARTAGSSGGKAQYELPSGFAKGQFVIRHWHGGRSTIEGQGIEPDVEVHQDIVELSAGIDSCLKAAEDWLGTQ